MDTQIIGNAAFNCQHCSARYALDATDLDFQKDIAADTGIDDKVNYLARLNKSCNNCQHNIRACFEVWEQPVGVANAIFYDEKNISHISCEFAISYYDYTNDEMESYDESDDNEIDG